MTETMAIDSIDALRERVRPPARMSVEKVIDHIDDLAAEFIASTPFIVISSVRADGQVDLSPRGDPPGFMKVLDRKTLAIPDRPGNRRADTFTNVITNPEIGIFCMIPGQDHTLRLAGRAEVLDDPALAETMVVAGHKPPLLLKVTVTRLLSHCAKAMVRSHIWKPERWPDGANVPSHGKLVKTHGALSQTFDEMEAIMIDDQVNNLY
ncbi:MAG: MSMEG_1061 family FMN-dependent PPOX-type flavoprotein [Pseudomonadota bacterium]